jgi:ADP-ribosylglycohydrolase
MFLGVAIGDALGVPVETFDAARIERDYGRITTYLQNPTHKWSATKPAGMWSDDTQLTLAVAESIIERGTFDLESQAKWHLRVLDEFGDLGLGGSTRDALNRIRAGVSPADSGKTDNPKRGMGNALPMKLSPAGALLASDLRLNPVDGRHNTASWFKMIRSVTDLTLMTHRTEVAVASALAHIYAVRHCLTRNP